VQAQPQKGTGWLLHSSPQDPLANQRVSQISAESGSLPTPSCPNSSMKPQSGRAGGGVEQEPLVWEEKAFREIKRALTNALSLGLLEPFFLYVYELKGDSCWGLDSATRLLASSGGLLVQTAWCHWLKLATLLACPSSHHCLGGRSRQACPRTRTHCLS
jgi:hypothetical protein